MDTGTVNITTPRDGVALIEFVGEHDLTTKAETAALLERLVAENDLVAVDLCSTTFIDSSFLNCLAIADRFAQELGHELRLHVCESPNVSAVLDITGLSEQLTIVTTRDDAVA